MTIAKSYIEPIEFSNIPRENLPTMYDLPSEDPQEPGLPDQFHLLQPRLLDDTFCPPNYPSDRIYKASDHNLYYDLTHPLWHKRPDCFAVMGVSQFYEGKDLRLSYVMWQEQVSPVVIVELLSPGTEKEDLGQTERGTDRPPTKWDVYEQILKVPYYIVFDRYTDELRGFHLINGQYQPVDLGSDRRIWMPEVGLGLGLWQGSYFGLERLWLRWYDAQRQWVSTESEQERHRAEQAEQRATEQQQRADRLAEQLKAMGINPDEL
jgi:Uma2 family endonuclease